LFLHWLIVRRDSPKRFILSMFIAPFSFLLLLLPLEWILHYGVIPNPYNTIKDMLTLSGSLTFANLTHPYASRPWMWVALPLVMPYWYGPHYFSAVSFGVWALIVPTFAYMIYRSWKTQDDACVFSATWFFCTYVLFIGIDVVTNRISYEYYFYPAVGAICLGLGIGLGQLWEARNLELPKIKKIAVPAVLGFLALHLAIFIVLSPLSPWPNF
jgi:dolichyl-phosphate-mannose-protein mannosyltransferase